MMEFTSTVCLPAQVDRVRNGRQLGRHHDLCQSGLGRSRQRVVDLLQRMGRAAWNHRTHRGHRSGEGTQGRVRLAARTAWGRRRLHAATDLAGWGTGRQRRRVPGPATGAGVRSPPATDRRLRLRRVPGFSGRSGCPPRRLEQSKARRADRADDSSRILLEGCRPLHDSGCA